MFDPASGQVFREWTIPRSSIAEKADRDWSRRRLPLLPTTRGARGPRSLLDMTTTVLANNIGDVSEEMLRALPTRHLWPVWRFLEARWVEPVLNPSLRPLPWGRPFLCGWPRLPGRMLTVI